MARGKKHTKKNTTSIGPETSMLPEDYTIASIESASLESIFTLPNPITNDNYNHYEEGEEEDDEHGHDKSYEFLTDAITDVSDVPTEKRSKVRLMALKAAFKALTCHATCPESWLLVQHRMSDIVHACVWSVLKSSKATEQYAACRCLEAMSVVLGSNEEEFVEEVMDSLMKAVKATGKDGQVRSAALRALSMSLFVCSSSGSSSTLFVMGLCGEVCRERWRGEDVVPYLRATALRCWSLLATTVDDVYVAGEESNILPRLQECLDHSDVELRAAAGECVALIHETRLNMGLEDGEGDEIRNASERKYRRGSWDGTEWEMIMDELKQRVSELAVEYGHHMSKKAKKEQRSIFRDIVATVVDDEEPSHVVSFRGGDIMLNSWHDIVQLDFVRHCLQQGFQIQLMTNPTLYDIFVGANGGMLSEAVDRLSQLEKRLYMSKTSDVAKAKDKNLRKKRLNRENQKNAFLSADGDYIS